MPEGIKEITETVWNGIKEFFSSVWQGIKDIFSSVGNFFSSVFTSAVNGIKKPAYFAYRFLSRLGNKLLKQGDGYFITQKEDKIVILLYNYSHYSAAYAEEIGINISYTDRYCVFPDNGIKEFGFVFPHTQGKHLIVHHILNREHGSAFDNFIKMGAIEPLSTEETEWLKKSTEPQIIKEAASSSLSLNITLQPFEIRLIEISPAE